MGIFSNLTNGKRVLNNISQNNELLHEVSEEEKKLLKQYLLEIFCDVKNLCEKYDIKYFLVYGTALGAVRHNGFIPWDDDLDISMPRKDYLRFCEVFEKELGDKYILNAPNYSNDAKTRFPKILMKGTHYREILDSRKEELQCVYIDIFILENIPDNAVEKKARGILCNAYEFIAGQVLLYENRDEFIKKYFCAAGKSNYYVRILIGFIFSFNTSSKWCDRIDTIVQYNNDNTKFVGLPTGRKHYFGDYFERSKVFPFSKGFFENIEVPLFFDVDSCLIELYGDYMKIPPVEKREKHFVREIRLKRG